MFGFAAAVEFITEAQRAQRMSSVRFIFSW
jgi:hypothetical protein